MVHWPWSIIIDRDCRPYRPRPNIMIKMGPGPVYSPPIVCMLSYDVPCPYMMAVRFHGRFVNQSPLYRRRTSHSGFGRDVGWVAYGRRSRGGFVGVGGGRLIPNDLKRDRENNLGKCWSRVDRDEEVKRSDIGFPESRIGLKSAFNR